MKFLALDIGTKRIGVATCDALEIAATPRNYVLAGKSAPNTIAEMARTEEIERIIVGFPVSLNGTENRSCEMVQRFVGKLETLSSVPIELVDERLTTKIAENQLIAHGMRREKRRESRDSVAAALILQSYLETRRIQKERLESRKTV